ncbi:hypothetical protein AUJ84_02755 [Candidatus Pacearchaeota archaeon CG1_02_32_132]|nr:MAG: hypothetical protein AUJ84_02755 [Candidatus Pacearchaeota archaeon CG1_02_32_132]
MSGQETLVYEQRYLGVQGAITIDGLEKIVTERLDGINFKLGTRTKNPSESPTFIHCIYLYPGNGFSGLVNAYFTKSAPNISTEKSSEPITLSANSGHLLIIATEDSIRKVDEQLNDLYLGF